MRVHSFRYRKHPTPGWTRIFLQREDSDSRTYTPGLYLGDLIKRLDGWWFRFVIADLMEAAGKNSQPPVPLSRYLISAVDRAGILAGPFKTRYEAGMLGLDRLWGPDYQKYIRRLSEFQDKGKSLTQFTEETANKAFDIVKEKCGASEDDRADFLYWFTHDLPSGEDFQFGGCFGFGGQFWYNAASFYVTTYREDEDPESRMMIARAGERLLDLYQEVLGEQ